MKGWDPEGNTGPRKPLPDSVQVIEPPLDKVVLEPASEQREPIGVQPQPVVDDLLYPPHEESAEQQAYPANTTAF